LNNTPENRVIAEFSDYSGLLAALRSIREMRNISFEKLDEIVGAPTGYFSKVFAPKSERKITMQSMGWAMAGLGVKAILVDDLEMLERLKTRYDQRDNKVVRAGTVHILLSRNLMRQNQRKGGENSRKFVTKAYAKKIARKAALIRWNDVKAAVAPVHLAPGRVTGLQPKSNLARGSKKPPAFPQSQLQGTTQDTVAQTSGSRRRPASKHPPRPKA